jgi:Ca-activated chloride channel family protein
MKVAKLVTFILLALISPGLAQTSSHGPLSVDHSQDVKFPLSAPQLRERESFNYGSAQFSSSVVPPVSVPFVSVPSPTIKTEVQEVNLTLRVTNRHGHFVSNLGPSDFTIHDNGEPPQKITYFESQSKLPLRLAIVIDTSDSVASAFDDEKRSAANFLTRILRSTSDLALIMGFNQEVRLFQELASDKRLLSHAIRKLPGGGYTAIYDAVSAASQLLAKVRDTQTVRRAIILITDGEDNSSHIKLEQAEEVAQRNECAVYVMSINPETNPEKEQSDRAMKEVSEVTGGTFLRVRTEEGLAIAFSKIDKELRSQYLMSYKPAGANPDGSFHRLVVSGPKELRVHHRDGYFAK